MYNWLKGLDLDFEYIFLILTGIVLWVGLFLGVFTDGL